MKIAENSAKVQIVVWSWAGNAWHWMQYEFNKHQHTLFVCVCVCVRVSECLFLLESVSALGLCCECRALIIWAYKRTRFKTSFAISYEILNNIVLLKIYMFNYSCI